ncbi:MAG: AAA family ATPase [Prevotella sp.]|jgi:predicted ATPase|nr:AAA family ATPase [Prevotella sp.]
MIYLEKFELLTEDEEWGEFHYVDGSQARFYRHTGDECYPYGIFPQKQFECIDFDNITVFYGGNGSGKTTLLNIIADKLGLYRITDCPQTVGFGYYLESCRYSACKPISVRSKFLTSDDVFNHILSVREENKNIAAHKKAEREFAWQAKQGMHKVKSIDLESENYEVELDKLRRSNEAKRLTARQFIKRRAGELQRQYSNGENALMFFDRQIEENALYLLDEPENSLSPQFQLELKTLIEDSAHYKNCQFAIATHSPFMLALNDAKIYNLDAVPVTVEKWYNLENMRIYYDFFKRYEVRFNAD